MSENKVESKDNSEKEPDVIFVQYDGDLPPDNNILLEESKEPPSTAAKKIKDETSRQNSGEEIDSPDLVNIEDYKISESFTDSPENEEDRSTAVLCETTLESDLNGAPKDKDLKFFQLVNIDENEKDNIIEDIPNEVLVYTCQPVNDNPLNKYLCKSCGIIVGCIFCLKSHYESIHLNLGIIQYRCDQTTYLKNYTEICHKCNLVCESKDEMFEHRKIHFVSCDVCDMSFDSALFLSNHCKTTHEKFEVIISCDLCEQWFKQLSDLSEHYEAYHEMILCIVCFKRFATIYEMERHHTTHKIMLKYNDQVLPYACSKCNHAFSEISDLSTHLTKAHARKKVDKPVVTPRAPFIKLTQSKKKSRSKKIKFDDCGGLSQDGNDNTDRKSKKIKSEED